MGSRRRVAIVVVNYGSSDLLRLNLLPSAGSGPEPAVVVVDNFSGGAEARRVTELGRAAGWTVVALPTNVGFGAGANAGVARARKLGFDTFLLLNPDARMEPASVAALADELGRRPLSLVTPIIERSDGTTWFRGGALDLERGRTRSRPVEGGRELPWLTGACLMTTAEVWDVVGGFDEDYFLYWEDVDLSVRAAAAGADLMVCPGVVAVHDEGGTQEPTGGNSEDMSDGYYYFNIRNRVLFASKNLSDRDRRRWMRHTVRESYRILLRGGGKRKFLRPWRPLGIGFRGIRDGYRLGRVARRSGGSNPVSV